MQLAYKAPQGLILPPLTPPPPLPLPISHSFVAIGPQYSPACVLFGECVRYEKRSFATKSPSHFGCRTICDGLCCIHYSGRRRRLQLSKQFLHNFCTKFYGSYCLVGSAMEFNKATFRWRGLFIQDGKELHIRIMCKHLYVK